ncbi:hypothetical protein K1T73_08550 [Roseovarius sp. SCSIO 43702]|uniref:hypothetical protein n=1 Tax=Roseovarius sp. SCSIO 43702 TaxID=2823043 RepID=UPI001C73267F|nr:hypothetical protein [Roseovarius sp. SCSIO 43702]QYX58386.1 hypothetical protein K1T73_08550 [Roseovarius sp. SCSIO 43702]
MSEALASPALARSGGGAGRQDESEAGQVARGKVRDGDRARGALTVLQPTEPISGGV